MGSYEPYPADSAAQQAAQQSSPAGRGPRPPSVQYAVWVVWAKIALNVVAALVTLLLLNSMVDAALAKARAGSSPVPDVSTIRAVVLAGTIIGLVVSVALMTVLAIFVRKGANWARITYTVLVALGLLTGLIGLVTGAHSGPEAEPVAVLVVNVLGMLLSVVVLILLWRKESNAWFRGR